MNLSTLCGEAVGRSDSLDLDLNDSYSGNSL